MTDETTPSASEATVADPIPCKGKQGVFTLPAEVAEALS